MLLHTLSTREETCLKTSPKRGKRVKEEKGYPHIQGSCWLMLTTSRKQSHRPFAHEGECTCLLLLVGWVAMESKASFGFLLASGKTQSKETDRFDQRLRSFQLDGASIKLKVKQPARRVWVKINLPKNRRFWSWMFTAFPGQRNTSWIAKGK